MRKTLSSRATDWREGRRLRAFELKEEGWSQKQIAQALGVSKGAVSQWMKRARDGGGVEALRHVSPPGAIPRLTDNQRAKFKELVSTFDAEAYGFRGKAWTGQRLRWLIKDQFGVSYHPAHVSRIARSLGLSSQRPTRRANQRDEEAIKDWKEKRWPELKRGR
jgi:transposase